jgi:hypothetical protein
VTLGHGIRDLCGQRERAAALLAWHERTTFGDDGINEVFELALQRLLILNRDFASWFGGAGPFPVTGRRHCSFYRLRLKRPWLKNHLVRGRGYGWR